MLLVNNDQPKVTEGEEDGTPGAKDKAGLFACNLQGNAVPGQGSSLAVVGQSVRENARNLLLQLLSEADVRDQIQHALSAAHGIGRKAEVKLRFP